MRSLRSNRRCDKCRLRNFPRTGFMHVVPIRCLQKGAFTCSARYQTRRYHPAMTIIKPGLLAVFLLAGACDKEAAPKAESTESTTGAVVKTPTNAAPPALDVDKKAKDLCKSMDTDALASVFGIAGLSGSSGAGVKGGGGPSSRSCSYYERGKIDNGVSLGVQFVGEPTLEKRDFMGRFSWKPFDGLGAPASIGRAEDSIHLQSVVHGVRVQLRTAVPDKSLAEVETAAVAAMKLLLEQVPADAAARLAEK